MTNFVTMAAKTDEPALWSQVDGAPADPNAGLVSSLQAGDERAFERLIRQFTPRLLAIASRLLPCEEDRADAVQDTFLCAFRSIGSFEGRSRLSTWLHRILINTCLAKLRRRSRSVEVPLDDLLPGGKAEPQEPAAPAGSAISQLASLETRAQVRACINRLPEAYRTVLVLRDIEELDTNQTARTLGATRAVVKTRLHRARQALRTLLNPHFRRDDL